VRDGEEREEGLDERGEAPPPYGAERKPPSLRSVDVAAPAEVRRSGERSADGEAVELRRMSGETGREMEGHEPPGYHAAVAEEDIGDITRPTTAVTASDRFGSVRRLLSNTDSTSHGGGS
jgi:hypothetical protein